MPSIFEGGDFESEMIILPGVRNLHKELIEETIKDQLRNPFEGGTDCIETFVEQIEELINEHGDELDSGDKKKIQEEESKFYLEIAELISDKYHLELYTEGIAETSLNQQREYVEALYSFFVLKYKKNIKNMMLNYILANTSSICSALDHLKKKKDVTTTSIRKKYDDSDLSMVLSNLQEVLDYIKTLNIDMNEIIDYLDLGNVNISTVKDLMTKSMMRSDYQVYYFSPLEGYQDCNYDDIVSKIENGIIKIIKDNMKK